MLSTLSKSLLLASVALAHSCHAFPIAPRADQVSVKTSQFGTVTGYAGEE